MALKSILTILIPGALAICAQSGDAQRPQALQALSRAAPKARWDVKSLVIGDIACDRRSDHVYLGHAAGKIYVGLFRSLDRKTQVLEFLVDAGKQDAICHEPATLATESLDYDLDDVEGFQKPPICRGLVLSDNACDSIHFFWNHSTSQLNWWRN